MAAQYVTLEEAAERLGIPTDEFKRRLKTEWTHLVPMRDGPTLRFRLNQIDELARQMGAVSDPELPLARMEESAEHGSDDFKVSPVARNKPAAKPEEPLLFESSASGDDLFSLSADAPKPAPGSSKSSDSSADSDVRLEAGKAAPAKGKGKGGDPEAIPTEEIALEAGGPSSAVIKGGSSAKLSAPKSSSSSKLSSASHDAGKGLSKPGTGESSEFELSLEADSDDFELQLNTDSSDEVELGSSPIEEAGKRGGKSGINLRDPADSGISLEKGRKPGDSSGKKAGSGKKSDPGKKSGSGVKPGSGKKAAGDSGGDGVDFELSLEPEPAPEQSSGRLSSPKSGARAPVTSDSDSEFELTLDDSGEGSSLEAAAAESGESKGDIFETDFEIPPMADDSGSEAVALDSDTDLEGQSEVEVALDEDDVAADEESGSQVVVLEDESEATPGGRRRKSKVRAAEDEAGDVDLADVEEESASGALRGVKARREEEEEEAETVPGGRPAPAPWGPVPAIILFPALLFITLGGLMGYELLHTMMGYQQPRKPAAPLVRGVAKTLDMDLKDQ